MTCCDSDELGFINAHGTATLFNDQMESVAIVRSGLQQIPVNALKGYFGHTLGAAGILETILSMAAMDDHTVLATKGFEELGVSGNIHLSSHHRSTDKHSFMKMISGFGGGNAAIVLRQNPSCHQAVRQCTYATTHRVTITPHGAYLDGKPVDSNATGADLLTDLYKRRVGDYPKFYKMDGLSRLGFIAAELLMQAEDAHETLGEGRAIVFVNRSSSIASDRNYQSSIQDADQFFPSPAVFVYTLPNIFTGEIAIRHHLHGETSFYILPEKDDRTIDMLLRSSLQDRLTHSMIGGWIDYQDSNHFEAEVSIIEVISDK
jgi:3-oxoacyl-[acyl-carrier-protein] synthase-1